MDGAIARRLIDAGVCDSKRIGSDTKIRELAEKIRTIHDLLHEVIVVEPPRYNDLYHKLGNVNRLLAWGHATVIERLFRSRPECPRALSDQFTSPKVLQEIVARKGLAIRLEQRTKAESDPAVAAGSILAREAFIDWLDQKETELGHPLPRGANREVQTLVREILARHGEAGLARLGKTHFKTSHPSPHA